MCDVSSQRCFWGVIFLSIFFQEAIRPHLSEIRLPFEKYWQQLVDQVEIIYCNFLIPALYSFLAYSGSKIDKNRKDVTSPLPCQIGRIFLYDKQYYNDYYCC